METGTIKNYSRMHDLLCFKLLYEINNATITSSQYNDRHLFNLITQHWDPAFPPSCSLSTECPYSPYSPPLPPSSPPPPPDPSRNLPRTLSWVWGPLVGVLPIHVIYQIKEM